MWVCAHTQIYERKSKSEVECKMSHTPHFFPYFVPLCVFPPPILSSSWVSGVQTLDNRIEQGHDCDYNHDRYGQVEQRTTFIYFFSK